MAMFRTIKAFVCDEGGVECEVRKFVVDKDFATSLKYLRSKLTQMIAELPGGDTTIFWRDADGDMIKITNDEELMVAIMENKKDILNIYVTLPKKSAVKSAAPRNRGEPHYGVVCDGCGCEVRGNRYKCQICPDFDLCWGCESAGKHDQHNMVRIAKPFEEKTIDEEKGKMTDDYLPIYIMKHSPKFMDFRYNNQVKQPKEYRNAYSFLGPREVFGSSSRSPRHAMKKLRPSTSTDAITKFLPMEEILKGCVNVRGNDDPADYVQKPLKRKDLSRVKKKSPTPVKKKTSNENKAENPEVSESLKHALQALFPNNEITSVKLFSHDGKKIETEKTDFDNNNDNISNAKGGNIQPEKEKMASESDKNTAEDDTASWTIIEDDSSSTVSAKTDISTVSNGGKRSVSPLTTLAALAAMANTDFVKVTSADDDVSKSAEKSATRSLPTSPSYVSKTGSESVPVFIPLSSSPRMSVIPPKADKSVDSKSAIADALSALEAMGLADEGGWLTKLVTAKNGNVADVLKALMPAAKFDEKTR